MKNFLVIILLIGTFFTISSTFAQNYLSAEIANTDPDLSLSIKDLRKKYSLSWFERKYGKYYYCEDNGQIYFGPKLICGFTNDSTKVKKGSLPTILIDPLNELRENQLKSLIANYGGKNPNDSRIDDI